MNNKDLFTRVNREYLFAKMRSANILRDMILALEKESEDECNE